MADRYEVYPDDGSWGWRRRVGKTVTKKAEGFDSRAEARADALEAREDADEGFPVVLVRDDGSLVGELDRAAGGSSSNGQRHVLEPAGEDGAA